MTFLAELNEQSHPVLQNYSVQLRVICCGIACWRQICCMSPFLFLHVTSASCLCLATEQFVTLKASQAIGLALHGRWPACGWKMLLVQFFASLLWLGGVGRLKNFSKSTASKALFMTLKLRRTFRDAAAAAHSRACACQPCCASSLHQATPKIKLYTPLSLPHVYLMAPTMHTTSQEEQPGYIPMQVPIQANLSAKDASIESSVI